MHAVPFGAALAPTYADLMHVPTSLLANGAGITSDSLLHIEGGGWEHFTCPSFPWGITGYLAGMFELDQAERDTAHIVKMSVRDEAGDHLHSSATMIVKGPGRLVPFAVQFSIVATHPGSLYVELFDGDGGLFCSVPCDIVARHSD